MSVRRRVLTVLLLATPALLARGAGALEQDSAVAIEQGRAHYEFHCQSCHGIDADGRGPMAESLSVSPPDLTRLRAEDGSFPAKRVHRMIDGRQSVPGHRRREMPIWGLNFQQLDRDSDQEDEVRRKIRRIVAYLESIQRSDED